MFISDSSLGLFCNMVMDEKEKKFLLGSFIQSHLKWKTSYFNHNWYTWEIDDA